MSKKAGIAIIILGAVLIVSALLLLLHNQQEDALAGQEAESLLEEVKAAIAQGAADASQPQDAQPTDGDLTGDDNQESAQPDDPTRETAGDSAGEAGSDLPTVTIQGYGYVGYLEIPVLNLTLPVMSDWSYYKLYIAPCRQFGSSRTDDLVIAAHNYNSHFGRLKNLVPGDTVTFTDMEGNLNTYAVAKTETINPYDVDAVANSGYALVLYTCTYGGAMRVVVFCDRVS